MIKKTNEEKKNKNSLKTPGFYDSLNVVSCKRSVISRLTESLVFDLKTIISLYLTEEYDIENFVKELIVITKSLQFIIYPGQTRLNLEKANIVLLKNIVKSLGKENDEFLPDKSKSINKNNRE